MNLSSVSPSAYDASAFPFLIYHTINMPWKLYKRQVLGGPSALHPPFYTDRTIGNFTSEG